MSYILDALKKVEYEKSIKANTGGITSISGNLFQERNRRPSRSAAWKLIAGIALISLFTFAVAWFIFNRNKESASSSIAPASVTATAGMSNPAVAPVVSAPPLLMAPAVTPPSAASASRPEYQAPKNVIQTIPAPAGIKVSGIAWQEERAARRVVINGLLLQEGTTVAGAKILEIHQDMVRFVSPAGNFDVRMDAATLQGMPK